MSRRKSQRRFGRPPSASVLQSPRMRFPNRQIALVESGLTGCKQTVVVRPNRQIFRGSAMFGFQTSAPVSTRKEFQVEIALSHSKQGIGTRPTRKYFRGSPALIFKSAISNLESSDSKKGVNQNQVFACASRSKQTLGARKGCQFFAMCFSAQNTGKDAGLKTPALHSNLLRAAAPILPTGSAVDYDAARSTQFGEGASHNVWVSPQYRLLFHSPPHSPADELDPNEIRSIELKEERDGHSAGSTAC